MKVTREVPAAEWQGFLDIFTGINRGRPVRLEMAVPPGEGEPLLADREPLLDVTLDRKGSEAPAVTITVGGLDAPMPRFTHVIKHPTHIWVEEERDGPHIALEIDSRDAGKTVLAFERVEALSAGSDRA